jgi:aconitase A
MLIYYVNHDLACVNKLYFLSIYSADALEQNQELEFERNKERFVFLKVCLYQLSVLV